LKISSSLRLGHLP
jgi:hypothetical protein